MTTTSYIIDIRAYLLKFQQYINIGMHYISVLHEIRNFGGLKQVCEQDG
jgi:hypothetical protein